MKNAIQAGEFVTLAEMEPPKGTDVSKMVNAAAKIKGNIDGLLVSEMSSAVMRMSALGASLILRNKGMEVMMQICCRDRNRLALQADLLAAAGLGISTLHVIAGDDPRYGDHPQTKPVYDIELPELLQTLQRLQSGRDMAGVDLAGSPQFLVGTSLNTGNPEASAEQLFEEMERMIHAGVRFFITPPLFDPSSLTSFLERVGHRKNKIIPTVLLLKSLGMARYIQRNIAHIDLPDSVVSRLQKSPDKVRESVKIAAETIKAVKKEGLGGVLISTMGWEHKIPEILDELRG